MPGYEDPVLIRLIRHHLKSAETDPEVTIQHLDETASLLDEVRKRKEAV